MAARATARAGKRVGGQVVVRVTLTAGRRVQVAREAETGGWQEGEAEVMAGLVRMAMVAARVVEAAA